MIDLLRYFKVNLEFSGFVISTFQRAIIFIYQLHLITMVTVVGTPSSVIVILQKEKMKSKELSHITPLQTALSLIWAMLK
jgi:hypothetical protein